MFINKLLFFMTYGWDIGLITVEFTSNRTAKQLAEKLAHVVELYRRAGYHVETILMDMEFDKIKTILPQLNINTTAAREHVTEVERCIREIKETCRGILANKPFKIIVNVLVIHLLQFVTMWLNAFPWKSGVSTCLSPRALVNRHKLNAKKHCWTLFGVYCKVHNEPEVTNTMMPCTHEAIFLRPMGKLQGSYKFLCLERRKKIVR